MDLQNQKALPLCCSREFSAAALRLTSFRVNAECRQPSCRAQTIALAPMGLLQGAETGKHEYC